MEELNNAISSGNNQQPTTIVSSITTITGNGTNVTQVDPQEDDVDFERDSKWEITTLEKASFDCNDLYDDNLQANPNQSLSQTSVDAQMEKVIDNIVELGGCQQFAQTLGHHDDVIDKDKEVEHIQREIIGERNLAPETSTQPDVNPAQNVEQQPEKQVNTVIEQEKSALKQASQPLPDLKLTQNIIIEDVSTLPPDLKAQDIDLESIEKSKLFEAPATQPTTKLEEPTRAESSVNYKTDECEPVIEETVVVEEVIPAVEETEIETSDGREEEIEPEVQEEEKKVEQEEKAEEKQVEPESKIDEVEQTIQKEDEQPIEEKSEEKFSEDVVAESKVQVEETPQKLVKEPVTVGRPVRSARLRASRNSETPPETPKTTSTTEKKLSKRSRDQAETEAKSAQPAVEPTTHLNVSHSTIESSGGQMEVIEHHQEEKKVESESKTDEVEQTVQEKDEQLKEETSEEKSSDVMMEEPNTQAVEKPQKVIKEPVSVGRPVRSARLRASRTSEAPPEEPKPTSTTEKKSVKRSRDQAETDDKSLQPAIKLTIRSTASRSTIATSLPSKRVDYHVSESLETSFDEDLKRHECSDCGYVTSRINNLVHHKKTLSCPVMKKAFNEQVSNFKKQLQSPKSNSKKRTSR